MEGRTTVFEVSFEHLKLGQGQNKKSRVIPGAKPLVFSECSLKIFYIEKVKYERYGSGKFADFFYHLLLKEGKVKNVLGKKTRIKAT